MNNDTLYLLDVSGFVHTGSVNKHAYLEQLVEEHGMWSTQITPAGGLSMVMNTLYKIVGTGDIIACCDRQPVIKQEMIPGYKGNREHKQSIEVSKQFTEYVLDQCGILTVGEDGYEADDIIYTYKNMLYNQYEHIYIYTMDSDLYFLVDDKTEIMPISSRSKHITKDNYHSTILGGVRYPYNTITLEKVLNGDVTDRIPGLPNGLRELAAEIFVGDGAMYDQYGDKDFLKMLAIDYDDICFQIDKVFPLTVDRLPEITQEPDKQMICNWGDAINNKFFKGRRSKDFDLEQAIIEVQSMGMYLESEQ